MSIHVHRLCLENGIVCGADSPEQRPAQPLATRSSDAAPLLPAVENNDEILLARVEKSQLLSRDAYEFFNGIELDGTTSWTTDSTIARSVWEFPLMTSVQQANYHPGLKRYIFANWAWISYDGYPRPDHTGDEKNGRTGHQRTQLSLVEAPNPWGPFSVFFRDDDWSGEMRSLLASGLHSSRALASNEASCEQASTTRTRRALGATRR